MIYFFSWIDPPIFSNFLTADFDARLASMLTLSLISPVPKIFNFVEFLLINLSFFKVSVLMSSEPLSVLLSIYDWIFSRFKIATFSVDI